MCFYRANGSSKTPNVSPTLGTQDVFLESPFSTLNDFPAFRVEQMFGDFTEPSINKQRVMHTCIMVIMHDRSAREWGLSPDGLLGGPLDGPDGRR